MWRHVLNDIYLMFVNVNENEETRGRGIIIEWISKMYRKEHKEREGRR